MTAAMHNLQIVVIKSLNDTVLKMYVFLWKLEWNKKITYLSRVANMRVANM